MEVDAPPAAPPAPPAPVAPAALLLPLPTPPAEEVLLEKGPLGPPPLPPAGL